MPREIINIINRLTETVCFTTKEIEKLPWYFQTDPRHIINESGELEKGPKKWIKYNDRLLSFHAQQVLLGEITDYKFLPKQDLVEITISYKTIIVESEEPTPEPCPFCGQIVENNEYCIGVLQQASCRQKPQIQI